MSGIEKLLELYEIDLHLLGKLHYDEFLKELSTLVSKERESAVRKFWEAQYLHILSRKGEVEDKWKYELSDQQKFLETYLNTTEEEDE